MSLTQLDFANELGLPQDAVVVNGRVWFQDSMGIRTVFVEQTPLLTYPLNDPIWHHFCAVQLVETGLVKAKQVCNVFDIQQRNLLRLRNKVRRHGIAGLMPKKPGRKPKRNTALDQGIAEAYQQGSSTYDIAEKLALSAATVRRALKDQGVPIRLTFDSRQTLLIDDDQGHDATQQASKLQPQDAELISDEPTTAEPTTDEPTTAEPTTAEPTTAEPTTAEPTTAEPTIAESTSDEPQATEPLVEATSIPYASPLDRLATMMGWIEEAPVEFQSANGVQNAGVFVGLALLEETHLLEEVRAVYGQLKNGWYGLRSLLWTLVVMALLRIKRTEQLKHHDPEDLGRVLGLPRAAEVKTIRRKLNEIAGRGRAAELHRRLAVRRAEQKPASLATLYIDGHVRAYHGKRRIGQTHVSRLKRVLRAEMDYWVHDAHGQPLLVVHEPVDTSFREALRDGVLPEIRRLVGQRRVRVVFDREGWSRELFDDLLRLNFDFITYRKGSYEPLPESEFREVKFQPPGQPPVPYTLAEATFAEEGWPRLRLVAVKKKNGGQTHVLATCRATWESLGAEPGAEDLPAEEIAWQMFHRWSQENWFKYMRAEYALDVLVDYSVELDDATRPVVNPSWRELDRQVKSSRSRLERSQAKYAKLILQADADASAKSARQENSEPGSEATPPAPPCTNEPCVCLRCRSGRQAEEVANLSAEHDRLCGERRETPRKIPLSQASDRDKLKLGYERKLFTDTIKLSAYEIETRLYAMVGATFGNQATEGRGLIQEILGSSGDLRLDECGVIEVHLEQLSSPRYTQALQSLCAQLNALSPRLPETSHPLRFFVKPRPVGE